MKYSQKVSKSGLQVVKIQLRHFLGMFHVQELRIKAVEIYTIGVNGVLMIFPMLEIGDFFGINTDLPNSIPYPDP